MASRRCFTSSRPRCKCAEVPFPDTKPREKDIRPADDGAAAGGDRDQGNHRSVTREGPAFIDQRQVLDFTGLHQNAASVSFAAAMRFGAVEHQRIAVFEQKAVALGNPGLGGEREVMR